MSGTRAREEGAPRPTPDDRAKLEGLKRRYRGHPGFLPVERAKLDGREIGDRPVLWSSVFGEQIVKVELNDIHRDDKNAIRAYMVREPTKELLGELEEVWLDLYLKSERNFPQYDVVIFLSAICAIESLLDPSPEEPQEESDGGAGIADPAEEPNSAGIPVQPAPLTLGQEIVETTPCGTFSFRYVVCRTAHGLGKQYKPWRLDPLLQELLDNEVRESQHTRSMCFPADPSKYRSARIRTGTPRELKHVRWSSEMMLPLTAEDYPDDYLCRPLRSLMVLDPMDQNDQMLESLFNTWEWVRHLQKGNTKSNQCRLVLSAICAIRSLRELGPNAPQILRAGLAANAPRV